MIAPTGVETIGRCLPPESGKICTLFHSLFRRIGGRTRRFRSSIRMVQTVRQRSCRWDRVERSNRRRGHASRCTRAATERQRTSDKIPRITMSWPPDEQLQHRRCVRHRAAAGQRLPARRDMRSADEPAYPTRRRVPTSNGRYSLPSACVRRSLHARQEFDAGDHIQ